MKVRSTVVLFLTLIGMSGAVAGTDGGGLPYWPTVPSIGYISEEVAVQGVTGVSYVSGYSDQGEGGIFTKVVECSAIDDIKCSKSQSIAANLYLPPCSKNESDICIAGLEVSRPDGQLVEATLDHEISTQKIPANLARGVPYGGGISLWKATSATNGSGSEEYSVAARIQVQNFANDKCSTTPQACLFDIANFSATVIPVSTKTGDYSISPNFAVDNSKYDSRNNGCAWSETGVCAVPAEFAPNTVVALTLHMDSRLTGFLNGRMKEIKISITPLSAKINKIRVEAKPVDIPSIYAFVAKNELSKFSSINTFWKSTRGGLYDQDIKSMQTETISPPPGFNMTPFEPFASIMKSGASTKSLWRFTSSSSFSGAVNPCLGDKSKLLGLVTTNASAYTAGPPTFDATTSSINYQVGGAHLDFSGEVFRGTYDLIMRSDVARCLYGYTSAPIKASVSIIGENQQNIAVVVQNEKDGWLRVGAYGFTFSQPTIRIKLSQEKGVAPTPPKPEIKEPKRVSITCKKGTTVKKVTAIKPVCPKGFVKK